MTFVPTRQCFVCREQRPLTEFRQETYRKHERYECNSCRGIRRRSQHANSVEVRRKNSAACARRQAALHPSGLKNGKVYELTKKFGITPESYLAMWAAQDGRCAICKDQLTTGKGGAGLDHNKKTHHIRKLLCQGCNTGIGLFKEDVERLRSAIAYLEHHNAIWSSPTELGVQCVPDRGAIPSKRCVREADLGSGGVCVTPR